MNLVAPSQGQVPCGDLFLRFDDRNRYREKLKHGEHGDPRGGHGVFLGSSHRLGHRGRWHRAPCVLSSARGTDKLGRDARATGGLIIRQFAGQVGCAWVRSGAPRSHDPSRRAQWNRKRHVTAEHRRSDDIHFSLRISARVLARSSTVNGFCSHAARFGLEKPPLTGSGAYPLIRTTGIDGSRR